MSRDMRMLVARNVLRGHDDTGEWPASRSAWTSDLAITMWPPSTIGGLDVTTAIRSFDERGLHANTEETLSLSAP